MKGCGCYPDVVLYLQNGNMIRGVYSCTGCCFCNFFTFTNIVHRTHKFMSSFKNIHSLGGGAPLTSLRGGTNGWSSSDVDILCLYQISN